TVDGGWPPSEADRALLTATTTDDLIAALNHHAIQAAVRMDALEREGAAFDRLMERFGDRLVGDTTINDLRETLPGDERAELDAIAAGIAQAALVGGSAKTKAETEADWRAGRVRVSERDEDGRPVVWQGMTILDDQVLAARAHLFTKHDECEGQIKAA